MPSPTGGSPNPNVGSGPAPRAASSSSSRSESQVAPLGTRTCQPRPPGSPCGVRKYVLAANRALSPLAPVDKHPTNQGLLLSILVQTTAGLPPALRKKCCKWACSFTGLGATRATGSPSSRADPARAWPCCRRVRRAAARRNRPPPSLRITLIFQPPNLRWTPELGSHAEAAASARRSDLPSSGDRHRPKLRSQQ
jgi:hypothetical protein